MAFADFSSLSLTEFIESNSLPDALWFFLHVPKTAGTSISFELDRLRPPYVNISIDYTSDCIDHDVALRHAVDRFCLTDVTRARSASGHVPVNLLDQIARSRPGIQSFTMLRDPVQRVMSEYVYQTTPMHPPFEAFRKRYPRVEDYVLDPSEQNKMFRFLSSKPASSDFAAAYKEIEGRFSFIGLTELHEMSFNVVTRLMGSDLLPVERLRATSEEAKRRFTASTSLRKLIRQVNQSDQELYSRVAGAILPKLAEWRALSGR